MSPYSHWHYIFYTLYITWQVLLIILAVLHYKVKSLVKGLSSYKSVTCGGAVALHLTNNSCVTWEKESISLTVLQRHADAPFTGKDTHKHMQVGFSQNYMYLNKMYRQEESLLIIHSPFNLLIENTEPLISLCFGNLPTTSWAIDLLATILILVVKLPVNILMVTNDKQGGVED